MVDFKALLPWRNRKSRAPTKPEDIFDPFVAFRRDMHRMFDEFASGDLLLPGAGQGLMPTVDIQENAREVVISAELPGVSEDNIDVGLAGDVLTPRGHVAASSRPEPRLSTQRL